VHDHERQAFGEGRDRSGERLGLNATTARRAR
jgi:hypothetical protein